MKTFLSPKAWYSLIYPDTWLYEIDDVCTTFFREDGVGAFQISAYETESRESAAVNLREYLDSKGIEAVIEQYAPSNGSEQVSSNFVLDGSLNKVWMFASDGHFVFMTYIRGVLDSATDEEEDVERMVLSFRFIE